MIWCVDDDSTIREIEVYTLTQTGFEARGFADGISMLEALKTEIPELIILDIMMPELDGLQVLSKLRSKSSYKDIPVIMATAKGTEMDKIGGLNSGADDYLVKPFGVMEMVARVKAVLRRTHRQSVKKSDVFTVGKLSVDVKQHEVRVDGEMITLTLKEFQMLKLLLKNAGIVLTRDQLLEDIWGYDFDGETRTVDVHVRTLRQKLGEAGEYIETVRGVGYKMKK